MGHRKGIRGLNIQKISDPSCFGGNCCNIETHRKASMQLLSQRQGVTHAKCKVSKTTKRGLVRILLQLRAAGKENG